MSHAIYQTPAFILKTKNMRESNKLVFLYTQKFGLVYASIQSVRELKSKMRSHTTKLSLVDVDLVRGRDIWRLTGIHENIASLSFVETPWYTLFDKLALLLQRLCVGEESNTALWDDIADLFLEYQKNKTETKNIALFEIIIITRVLYQLGYWYDEEDLVQSSYPYTTEILAFVDHNKKKLIHKINQGIQDSQL